MSQYKQLHDFGRGAFGNILLTENVQTKTKCIIRVFECDIDVEKATKEIDMLKSIRHPNLVPVYDVIVYKEGTGIVTEFCGHGSLQKFLQRRNDVLLPENQVWVWILQLISAVKYFHDENILHREIATVNVLMSKDCLKLRLGDFGVEMILKARTTTYRPKGPTPMQYKAPELFTAVPPYSFKSDIFAVGCVVYEICALKQAFPRNRKNMKSEMKNTNPMPVSEVFSSELRSLLTELMDTQPDARPCAADICGRLLLVKHIPRWMRASAKRSLNVTPRPSQISTLTEQVSNIPGDPVAPGKPALKSADETTKNPGHPSKSSLSFVPPGMRLANATTMKLGHSLKIPADPVASGMPALMSVDDATKKRGHSLNIPVDPVAAGKSSLKSTDKAKRKPAGPPLKSADKNRKKPVLPRYVLNPRKPKGMSRHVRRGPRKSYYKLARMERNGPDWITSVTPSAIRLRTRFSVRTRFQHRAKLASSNEKDLKSIRCRRYKYFPPEKPNDEFLKQEENPLQKWNAILQGDSSEKLPLELEDDNCDKIETVYGERTGDEFWICGTYHTPLNIHLQLSLTFMKKDNTTWTVDTKQSIPSLQQQSGALFFENRFITLYNVPFDELSLSSTPKITNFSINEISSNEKWFYFGLAPLLCQDGNCVSIDCDKLNGAFDCAKEWEKMVKDDHFLVVCLTLPPMKIRGDAAVCVYGVRNGNDLGFYVKIHPSTSENVDLQRKFFVKMDLCVETTTNSTTLHLHAENMVKVKRTWSDLMIFKNMPWASLSSLPPRIRFAISTVKK